MAKNQGEPAFDHFFQSVYEERWPQIKAALLEDDAKVARVNQFYSESPGIDEITKDNPKFSPSPIENCFEISDEFDLKDYHTSLYPFYRMDPASIVPAKALQVQPGDRVLDMCAAPGGKSLILLEDLRGEGEFVANELSAKRRFRMMSVFKRYLPQEIRRLIHIRGIDGARFGLEKKDPFDKILLDAPCSGERGVIQKPSELKNWKEKRSKNFAIRQYSLLSSAFLSLKPGGRIVYSTCSISPYENDGVIAKLHKRHEGAFEVIKSNHDKAESTEFGNLFLPDQGGWGPIYYCIVEKH